VRLVDAASGTPEATTAAIPADLALVACDWNGTLVADADRAIAATNEILRLQGLPELDEAGFRASFMLPLEDFFASIGVERRHAAQRAIDWSRHLVARPTRLAPGALALMTAAEERGIPVGVVSAAWPEAEHTDAEVLAVLRRLAFVEAGAVNKAAVLHRLVALAAGPVAYVGDTEYDVRSALAAGAIPIGVGNGYRPAIALRSAGADLVVEDLSGLAALVTPRG
jgi:phosphoglycolate phosphatase